MPSNIPPHKPYAEYQRAYQAAPNHPTDSTKAKEDIGARDFNNDTLMRSAFIHQTEVNLKDILVSTHKRQEKSVSSEQLRKHCLDQVEAYNQADLPKKAKLLAQVVLEIESEGGRFLTRDAEKPRCFRVVQGTDIKLEAVKLAFDDALDFYNSAVNVLTQDMRTTHPEPHAQANRSWAQPLNYEAPAVQTHHTAPFPIPHSHPNPAYAGPNPTYAGAHNIPPFFHPTPTEHGPFGHTHYAQGYHPPYQPQVNTHHQQWQYWQTTTGGTHWPHTQPQRLVDPGQSPIQPNPYPYGFTNNTPFNPGLSGAPNPQRFDGTYRYQAGLWAHVSPEWRPPETDNSQN